MIAGQGTPDQLPARLVTYRYPEALAKLVEVLATLPFEAETISKIWLVLRGLWSHVDKGIRVVRKHEPD
jgi:hypothetical protein